ncbi:helix-turn-helix domain-containing protein [Archangium lansingense]|uniref:Helix-turn-helix domain-containing protein n=2 Tax=Archangium lansingense TaxID=2995310 RepID=A0ABT3ZW59_9BACT|nr:helix-turn-helix domain-containing protein [Archangium lansinium]MCY1073632.1 helix-turn-helix domain-containing protein [Archangium lansinium]
MKSLGEVARVARERLGLTQTQVARQIGIAPNVYGRIERGHMMPSVPTLRRMALVLGLSSDVLLVLGSADVAPSLETPAPENNLAPELRQTVRMLRGWSPIKVKWLNRILKAIENVPEEE